MSGADKTDWFKGLTEKQRRFCEAYSANGGNATKAAESAGYSNAPVEGARLIRKDKTVKALELLRQSTTSEEIATREERQAFWTKVMRDPTENMQDRIKCSEILGKAQADFINRHEHKVSPVTFNITIDGEEQ